MKTEKQKVIKFVCPISSRNAVLKPASETKGHCFSETQEMLKEGGSGPDDRGESHSYSDGVMREKRPHTHPDPSAVLQDL